MTSRNNLLALIITLAKYFLIRAHKKWGMQIMTTINTNGTEIQADAFNQQFFDQGFIKSVDIFTPEEAGEFRQKLEELEQQMNNLKAGNKDQLNFPHLLFTFANAIARTPQLLDAVEAIIGPNIMVWGSTFFIKEPNTKSFVSWHQDMKYWGLDDTNAQVSAWVALNNVNVANGCMQFLPETHKGDMVNHHDSFAEENALTRGQEAEFDFDPEDIVQVELKPGQVSFHHGKLLHSSAPNMSDDRRIGYAIQFIAPHIKQTVASKDFAMLVRGTDDYGYFEQVPPPQSDLADEAIAIHSKVLNYQNEAFYEGAEDAKR